MKAWDKWVEQQRSTRKTKFKANYCIGIKVSDEGTGFTCNSLRAKECVKYSACALIGALDNMLSCYVIRMYAVDV